MATAARNGKKPILLETPLKEERRFSPPAGFQERARVKDRTPYEEALRLYFASTFHYGRHRLPYYGSALPGAPNIP